MEFSYEEMEAATNGFSLDFMIGKGSHGHVYKGTLKGGKLVAIKKPLKNTYKLDNEIAILKSMKGNSNLVNLIGTSKNLVTDEQLLVMELMPYGSLEDLLHSDHPPSWPKRAAIVLQVATSLLSLHNSTPPIIHRDVKPANILFDYRCRARLADFSLAAHGNGCPRPPAAGTIGYLDPCYTSPDKLGTYNDVFSFGVVLLELVSSSRAIDVGCEPKSVVAWAGPLIRGKREVEAFDTRVEVPVSAVVAVERMLGVAERCISCRVARRPTMVEVVAELKCVVEDLSKTKLVERVYKYVRAWRRRVSRKVTATRIVCREHLLAAADRYKDDDNSEEVAYVEGAGSCSIDKVKSSEDREEAHLAEKGLTLGCLKN